MSRLTLICLVLLASWATNTASFNFFGLHSVKRRFSKLRSGSGDGPKFFTTEVIDISVPYDAAAQLAYESSDKSMAFERFKIKYLEDAVALVKSKQSGYEPIKEVPMEPIDVSIPYDAAALIAYESSDSRLTFEAYKPIYIEESVNMVTTKQKSRTKVGVVPLMPKPPGYRPSPPKIDEDRVAKYIAKLEKDKDMAIENALEFLKTAEFKRPDFPELQKGVPTEKVKGAALLTAALALLTTKGVVISSAAGASAAYAALQQGALGDVFRTFGGATWDATEAAVQLARAASADERVTGVTKELAASVAGAVDRYKNVEIEVGKSHQGSDMEEVESAEQTLEESSEDLTRILEEAEAAIGQADAAMALADETLGKKSEAEELDYDDDFFPEEELVIESEEEEKNNVPEFFSETESPEDEGVEEDKAADEMDDEWAVTLQMAQQGIDGKIVGMDEVINDDGAKADWDAAGILAKELEQAGSDEMIVDDTVDEGDVLQFSEEGVDDSEAEVSSSDSDMEAADDMFADGDLEVIARAAREAVSKMNDGLDEEYDYSESVDSDLEAVDAMLPEGDLEDIARAAREAVAMLDKDSEQDQETLDEPKKSYARGMRDWSKLTVAKLREELRVRGLKAYGRKADLVSLLEKYDAEAFPESVAGTVEESSSSGSGEALDFDEIDLAELGRQARAAVEAYEDLDDDSDKDEVEAGSEDSDDLDTDDFFAGLDLDSLGAEARAAVDAQPVDEPSDDVLQELEQELFLASAKDFSSMTVVELKNELRSRGLKLSGKKAKLIERLESA